MPTRFCALPHGLLHQSPQKVLLGGFDSAIHAQLNPPMNTLGSPATDRSIEAGRPQWPGRPVRMVVAPVLPLNTRRIRHSALPSRHVRIGVCLESFIRNKPNLKSEGGGRPK